MKAVARGQPMQMRDTVRGDVRCYLRGVIGGHPLQCRNHERVARRRDLLESGYDDERSQLGWYRDRSVLAGTEQVSGPSRPLPIGHRVPGQGEQRDEREGRLGDRKRRVVTAPDRIVRGIGVWLAPLRRYRPPPIARTRSLVLKSAWPSGSVSVGRCTAA